MKRELRPGQQGLIKSAFSISYVITFRTSLHIRLVVAKICTLLCHSIQKHLHENKWDRIFKKRN